MLKTDEWKVLILAAYALSAAKGHVDGCGGYSVYTILQNDGTVGLTTSVQDGPCRNLDAYAKEYERLVMELLTLMADDTVDDARFGQYIADRFTVKVLSTHRAWRKDREDRERKNMRASILV